MILVSLEVHGSPLKGREQNLSAYTRGSRVGGGPKSFWEEKNDGANPVSEEKMTGQTLFWPEKMTGLGLFYRKK